MKIKVKNKLILVILSAVILIIPVGISKLQEQQAFAPRTCAGCAEFLKLTAQFEREAGQSILEFAAENHPNNYPEFRQLTAKFKTDVMNALTSNPPEPEKIPELHKVYTDDASRLFLGGPDTLPGLLVTYSQGVQEIFGLGPR